MPIAPPARRMNGPGSRPARRRRSRHLEARPAGAQPASPSEFRLFRPMGFREGCAPAGVDPSMLMRTHSAVSRKGLFVRDNITTLNSWPMDGIVQVQARVCEAAPAERS